MKSKKNERARGNQLDEALDRELALMLSDGVAVSPISIPVLTARLGLRSRSTLHTTQRKEKIHAAIARQRTLNSVGTEIAIRRKSLEEKIEVLERENVELRAKVNSNLELMCRIVANATAKGWDVDYILSPLAKSRRELIG